MSYWDQCLHTFAQVRSRQVPGCESWLPFRHLVYLSGLIQDGVSRGGLRLILSVPPRHGKSLLASQWLPAWRLHLDSSTRVILASAEAEYAGSWGRKVRDCVDPAQLRRDSRAVQQWETLSGGGMVTAGVGGSIIGRGGDLLVLDDPYKNWKQAQSRKYEKELRHWFQSTFLTRCEPGASVIVIHTRWNVNDLTGWLTIGDESGQWKHAVLPAIAGERDPIGRAPGEALCPERYTIEALREKRDSSRGVGTTMFRTVFQQDPSDEGLSLWRRSWFQHWKTRPAPTQGQWFQSWDLSFKSGDQTSHVCGELWCADGARRYLVHQVRGQWDIVETMAQIVRMSRDNPQAQAKLVEDKANGPAVMRLLRDDVGGLIPVEPYGSKYARAMAVQPQIQAGNVFLPDPDLPGHRWVHDYLDEVCSFPNSSADDQVDTTSQALTYAGAATGAGIFVG